MNRIEMIKFRKNTILLTNSFGLQQYLGEFERSFLASRASLEAQMAKSLPAMQKTRV